MHTSHFIVSPRDNAWQISFRGDVTAPLATRESAIAAAIEMAGKLDDTTASVIVHDTDTRSETVWRGDGASLSDSESEQLAAEVERQRDA